MMTAVALLLAAAAAAAAPAAPDAARPRLQITMHLDRGVTIDRDMLADIASRVRAVWRPYVDVTVAMPGRRGSLVAADDLHLVLTDRTLPYEHGLGLGWFAFVDGEPQAAMSVSLTAVRRLTNEASWRGRSVRAWPSAIAREFDRRVLARAIAHEVGHYLLGTKTHANTGLMRASLNSSEGLDRPTGADHLADADLRRLHEQSPLFARNGQ